MDDAASITEVEPMNGQPTALATVRVSSGTLFGADDPDEVVARASKHARALTGVLRDRHLTSGISGKDYVRVEGWTLLGSMVGVFPVEVSTTADPKDWRERGMERPDGYVAVVEARTLDGAVVGRANARCMRTEKRWSTAEDYAIASMAQTRATSKALRMPLGFIVVLAGYDPTPAEEVPAEGFREPGARPRQGTKTVTAPALEDPAKAELSALWREATDLIGTRKDVLDWYRAAYEVTGTVAMKQITAEHLRRLIGLAQAKAAEQESGTVTIEGEGGGA